MPQRPKLFVGVGLDPRTRSRCTEVALRLERSGLRARFEAPEKLHITLAFLGWVEMDRVEVISKTLSRVAAGGRPFNMTLDKVGAFPHERNPHVVWVGSRGGSPEFRVLAKALRDAYEELGFELRKDALAHVTLARIREDRTRVPLIDIKPIRIDVRELTLFESLPGGRTTRYEVRLRARLGNATP